MEHHLKYRMYGKGRPPCAIRVDLPAWARDGSEAVEGSAIEPWHYRAFVEGSTYGIELVYPYHTECRVINEAGHVRMFWDFARESGAGVSGGEFVRFAPKHYLFKYVARPAGADGTRVAPRTASAILHRRNRHRTHAHHRQFADAMWPKLFFVAFKAPLPGERHIFRKSEPYAQIIVVPRRVTYQIGAMTTGDVAADS